MPTNSRCRENPFLGAYSGTFKLSGHFRTKKSNVLSQVGFHLKVFVFR